MNTRIIMVRHGYSAANQKDMFVGHTDVELTAQGVEQALLCAKWLEREKIDAVYSSDLQRAVKTARPIALAHGLEVNVDSGLREIFAGDWEQEIFSDLFEKYPEEFGLWCSDIGLSACVGGESVAQLAERIVAAVTRIAEGHPGQTVCITSHATPIRAMSTVASGIPVAEMKKVPWSGNASINIFEYEDGVFRAVELDITEHLGDLKTALPGNV